MTVCHEHLLQAFSLQAENAMTSGNKSQLTDLAKQSHKGSEEHNRMDVIKFHQEDEHETTFFQLQN